MSAMAMWVGEFVEVLCCGVVSYHRVGRVDDFQIPGSVTLEVAF